MQKVARSNFCPCSHQKITIFRGPLQLNTTQFTFFAFFIIAVEEFSLAGVTRLLSPMEATMIHSNRYGCFGRLSKRYRQLITLVLKSPSPSIGRVLWPLLAAAGLYGCGGDGLGGDSSAAVDQSSQSSQITSTPQPTVSSAPSGDASSQSSALAAVSSSSVPSVVSGDYGLQWQKPLSPQPIHELVSAEYGVEELVVSDVDSDGDMDGIAVSRGSGGYQLLWLENIAGAESDKRVWVVDGDSESGRLAVADLNSDGLSDVVIAGGRGTRIYWGSKLNGQYALKASYQVLSEQAGMRYGPLTVVDINGDGALDILRGANSDLQTLAYLNSGELKNKFLPHILFQALGVDQNYTVVDIDSDGDRDIVTVNRVDDQIELYRNSGAQLLAFDKEILAENTEHVSIAAGDFDGDGDGDLLAYSSYRPSAQLYWNAGKGGGFIESTLISSEQGWNGFYAAIEDVDGDGAADIIVNAVSPNKLLQYSFDGELFHLVTGLQGVSYRQAPIVADVNGDGLDDYISVQSAQASLWQGQPQDEYLVQAGQTLNVHIDANVKSSRNHSEGAPAITYSASVISGAPGHDFEFNSLTGELSYTAPSHVMTDSVLVQLRISAETQTSTIYRNVVIRSYTDDGDDDNDGVVDTLDAFPLLSLESADFDGDGIGDNADGDDDGDGVLDETDVYPRDSTEWLDTDGDGMGNNRDADDDNDGVSDEMDFAPLDSQRSLPDLPNYRLDSDGDGVLDIFDNAPNNSQSAHAPLWVNSDPAVNGMREVKENESIADSSGLNSLGRPNQSGVSLSIGDISDYFSSQGNQDIRFTRILKSKFYDLNGDGRKDWVGLVEGSDVAALVWSPNDAGAVGASFEIVGELEPALGTLEHSSGLLLEDLDGDQDLDVIFYTHRKEGVFWYKNSGGNTPSFVKQDIMPGVMARHISTIDANNDGNLDLLVMTAEAVVLYQNQAEYGDLTYQSTVLIPKEQSSNGKGAYYSVLVGDIDNNGWADVLTISTQSGADIWVHLNYEGQFEKHVIAGLSDTYRDFHFSLMPSNLPQLHDLDGDGWLDLVFVKDELIKGNNGYYFQSHIYFLRNQTAYSESQSVGFSIHVAAHLEQGVNDFGVHDIDGDGDLDLVFQPFDYLSNTTAIVLENVGLKANDSGTPHFVAHRTGRRYEVFFSNTPTLSVESLDQSGVPKIFFAPDQQNYLTSQALNTHDVYVLQGGTSSENLEARDADGDTINYAILNTLDFNSQLFTIDENTGEVSFGPAPLLDKSLDINGDGVYEIWVSASDGTSTSNLLLKYHVYENPYDADGDGVANEFDGLPFDKRFSLDYDGDGIPNSIDRDDDNDGVLNNYDTQTLNRLESVVPVWQAEDSTQAVTLSRVEPFTSSTDFTALHVVDFDNDGDSDIFLASETDSAVFWLENNGGAIDSFPKHVVASGVKYVYQIYTHDLDLDGRLDVIFADGYLESFQPRSRVHWYQYRQSAQAMKYSIGNSREFSVDDLILADVFGNFIRHSIGGRYDFRVSELTFADINRDELPDVLVAGAYQQLGYYQQQRAEPDDSVSFSYTQLGSIDSRGARFLVADFDNNGWQDILLTGVDRSDYLTIFKNMGDDRFEVQSDYSDLYTRKGQLVDAGYGYHGGFVTASEGQVILYRSLGLQRDIGGEERVRFDKKILGVSKADDYRVTDVDLDGDDDLLGLGRSLYWLENTGQGDRAYTAHSIENISSELIAISDFNNDGLNEILSIEGGALVLSRISQVQLNTLAEDVLHIDSNAVDADNNNLEYQLNSGALGELASVDPSSGQITVSDIASIDGLDTSVGAKLYDLWLTVTDGLSSLVRTISILIFPNVEDSDGDGVANTEDAFKFDRTRSRDSDADGISDRIDTDDDNDGVSDIKDSAPLNAGNSIAPGWLDNAEVYSAVDIYSRSIDDSRGFYNFQQIDVNNDGLLDFIATKNQEFAVYWFENTGNAELQFVPHILTEENDTPDELRIIDVNNDGWLDVWVDTGTAKLFINNGGQGFSYAQSINYGSSQLGIEATYLDVLVDWNYDGYIDVLRNNTVYLHGKDYQYLGEEYKLSPSLTGIIVDAKDYDQDGDIDLVSRNSSGDGQYTFNLNASSSSTANSNPASARFETVVIPQYQTADFYSVDLDQDGDVDIVTRYYEQIHWFENYGYGNFKKHILNDDDDLNGTMQLVDRDGDGDLDLVFGSLYWLENHLNSGARFSLNTPASELKPRAGAVLVADFNQDGEQDWLISTYSPYSNADGTLPGAIELYSAVDHHLVTADPQAPVGEFLAYDLDGNNVDYAITLGADAELFKVDSGGMIYFREGVIANGYPDDADNDGVYDFWLSISDEDSTRNRRVQVQVAIPPLHQ